jgi:hypothetical protein
MGWYAGAEPICRTLIKSRFEVELHERSVSAGKFDGEGFFATFDAE